MSFNFSFDDKNKWTVQLHFRSGVGGDAKVTEAAEELLQELEQLHFAVKEQTAALETTLQQIEHYQQVQLLRA